MGKVGAVAGMLAVNATLMAANVPLYGVSAGTNLVSAASVSMSGLSIPLSSVCWNSKESNSMNIDATGYQFFFISFR